MTGSGWLRALSSAVPLPARGIVQVAADGRWEEAVPTPDGPFAEAAVRACADAAEHDVAIELMWPGLGFVGARWPVADTDDARRAARRAAGTPLATFAEGLAALLLAPPGEPAFAELGAVDAWLSTGPLTLWHRGEPVSESDVHRGLQTRPDLAACHRPVALELATTLPRACWVGVVVSRPVGSAHHVDPQRLLEVLHHVEPRRHTRDPS